MSRGWGRIERAIFALFDHNPSSTYTTRELCVAIYDVAEPSRAQISAMLRASRKVADGGWIDRHPLSDGARGMIHVNPLDARSIAIGQIRRAFAGRRTVAECEALLDDPKSEPYALAQPDGYWGLQARRNIAYAGYRDDECDELQQRITEIYDAEMASRRRQHSSPSQHGATS